MIKTTWLSILSILLTQFSLAQKYSVSGIVRDTSDSKTLFNALIEVTRLQDSLLINFTRSKSDGRFTIQGLDGGKYKLKIIYPQYGDFVQIIQNSNHENLNLGTLPMSNEGKLLEAVIVEQKIAAMRLKGDTVEFKADSFKLKEGATIEELLKKLPGIEVDKDGKIKAMGEEVKKVLLDGDEFFGNDPTILTQNLDAKIVDKVQLYDKKSDQASLTGVDDGKKEKAINIQLKKEMSKGVFGKLEAAYGLKDIWNNSAMFNSFLDKRKLTGYGLMSSVGKKGLDYSDVNDYGEGYNMEYNEEFGYYMMNANSDDLDQGLAQGGISKNWNAGVNYTDQFDEGRQKINGNYKYYKLDNETENSSNGRSVLPDTVFYNSQKTNANTMRITNSGVFNYELKSDSGLSIKLRAKAGDVNDNIFSTTFSQSLNAKGDTVNNNFRRNNGDQETKNLNTSLFISKKFHKPGRTISVNLEQQYVGKNINTFLYSQTKYSDATNQSLVSLVDQMKTDNISYNRISPKFVYTEPLSKGMLLQFNYAFELVKNNSERLTYNRGASGKYDQLNDTLSDHYLFNVLDNSAGLDLKFSNEKTILSAGGNFSHSQFDQNNLFRDTTFSRNYNNYFPRLSFIYKVDRFTNIILRYDGNTRQPSINQIQPVIDNLDPLHIMVGNPLLKQQFTHAFNLGYNSYKQSNQRSLNVTGNFSFTANAIVNNTYTDSLAKTVNTFTNINGNYTGILYFRYSKKWAKPDINISPGITLNVNRYKYITNGIVAKTINNSYGFTLGAYKSKEDKYEISYYGSFTRIESYSSINTSLSTGYWAQTHNINIDYYLPLKFEFGSDADLTFRQKTDLFPKSNYAVWNAYLEKKIFKKDKASIVFDCKNILNTKTGYSRVIMDNSVVENNYLTLGRYYLLTFRWKFSKMPVSKNDQNK